jgi:uncharacterized cofD-like protein
MDSFDRKNIVCIGGGTGLSALLSGLKRNPWVYATALVSMFDDGGSSGVLRDRFGILPPGDILKCLLALSEDEVVARKILQKRIQNRIMPNHTGGNMLLMALESVYGNYMDAVDALGQILSIRGSVIPITLENAVLCAQYTDETSTVGEVNVEKMMCEGHEVRELQLKPPVRATQSAVSAIEHADALCIGPGSLYTSVLPNFLPIGIKEAISSATVPCIFICNLLTEGEGMRGFDIPKIVGIVERHIGRRVSAVIVNSGVPDEGSLRRYAEEHKFPINPSNIPAELADRIVLSDLWTDPSIARHDSDRLAEEVFTLAHGIGNRP